MVRYPWRAPSWSWASLDGTIYAETPFETDASSIRVLFQVLDVNIKLATADPFGRVESGEIQLRGSLHRTTVFKADKHPVPICVWLGDSDAHVRLDVEHITEGSTLFCLPLHMNTRPDNGTIYGIVPEPADNPGRFYRRGAFYVSSNEKTEQWEQMFSSALKMGSELREFGPMVGRHEIMEWKQYLITLI